MQALLAGEEVSFIYESVRLFFLCESMRWAHLPSLGGLYDQNTQLMDEWQVLFGMKIADHNAKVKEIENKTNALSRQTGTVPRIRR